MLPEHLVNPADGRVVSSSAILWKNLDDNLFVTSSDEGEIRAWNLSDRSLAWQAQVEDRLPWVSLDHGIFAFGEYAGGIQVVQVGSWAPLQTIAIPTAVVYSLALRGDFLGVGQEDGTATVWNYRTAKKILSHHAEGDPVVGVLLTSNKAVIISELGWINVFSLVGKGAKLEKTILNETPP
ncbi:MAG TPA: hypothetical protein VKK79_26140 [Candidatus Lokiarchaeia archaeon]|nr:hypothetical protein [Candidatus Lokiarchaeia archaeon]